MAECFARPVVTETPRKRKINGRKKDAAKIKRIKIHTTGEDCKCSRLKCFERIDEAARQSLIEGFNAYSSKDSQDAYLSTMVVVLPVKQRRCRRKFLQT